MNSVTVTGNLTKKPERYLTKENKIFTILTVAVNEKDATTYTDFMMFNENIASNCVQYLDKGSKVLVEGSLRNKVSEENGKKVYKYGLIAHRVEFLDSRKKENIQTEEVQNEEDNFGYKGANDMEFDDSDLPFFEND